MKLKQVKPKALLRALLKSGCVIKRQKGSHVFLEKISKEKTYNTSISLHIEPLPKGTLRGILKQINLTEEEIIKLLK